MGRNMTRTGYSNETVFVTVGAEEWVVRVPPLSASFPDRDPAAEGRLLDVAMACVGGGSNAIGLLTRFIGELDTRLIGVEAAG